MQFSLQHCNVCIILCHGGIRNDIFVDEVVTFWKGVVLNCSVGWFHFYCKELKSDPVSYRHCSLPCYMKGWQDLHAWPYVAYQLLSIHAFLMHHVSVLLIFSIRPVTQSLTNFLDSLSLCCFLSIPGCESSGVNPVICWLHTSGYLWHKGNIIWLMGFSKVHRTKFTLQ